MSVRGDFSTSHYQGGEKVETGGDPTPSTTTYSGVWGGGGELPTSAVEVEASQGGGGEARVAPWSEPRPDRGKARSRRDAPIAFRLTKAERESYDVICAFLNQGPSELAAEVMRAFMVKAWAGYVEAERLATPGPPDIDGAA